MITLTEHEGYIEVLYDFPVEDEAKAIKELEVELGAIDPECIDWRDDQTLWIWDGAEGA